MDEDEMTVSEARQMVADHLVDGMHCPVCDQFAKLYKRKLNSGMAYALVTMARRGGSEWLHKPTVLKGVGASARDESLLRYWGLVEEETEARPDGGRSGWWRVTPKGFAFLRGEITVPSHALVYDGRCLGFTGDPITIREALKEKFDLAEMMGWGWAS